MQVQIHYLRIDRHPENYREGLLVDEGWRIRTLTHFTPEVSRGFSKHWIESGLLPGGSTVMAVAKYIFPGEPFVIMEPLGAQGESFGLYVDICLPVQRREESAFEIYDLMLDLWFPPAGPYQELDWDEFEQARFEEKISPENVEIAARAMERLRREILEGRFPEAYVRPPPSPSLQGGENLPPAPP